MKRLSIITAAVASLALSGCAHFGHQEDTHHARELGALETGIEVCADNFTPREYAAYKEYVSRENLSNVLTKDENLAFKYGREEAMANNIYCDQTQRDLEYAILKKHNDQEEQDRDNERQRRVGNALQDWSKSIQTNQPTNTTCSSVGSTINCTTW